MDTGAAVARLPELARALGAAVDWAAPAAQTRRMPPYLADLAARAAPPPPPESGTGAAEGARAGPTAGVQDPEDSYVTVEAAETGSCLGAGDSGWEADPATAGAGHLSQSEVGDLVVVDVGQAEGGGAAEAPGGGADAAPAKEDANNGEVGVAANCGADAAGEGEEEEEEDGEEGEEGKAVLGLAEWVLLQSGAMADVGAA